MKKLAVLIAVTISLALTAGLVQAQDKAATPAQAREMVKKAVAYAKQVGCEKAFAEFNTPASLWNKTYSNVYMSAGDWNGITVVQGKYPMLVGQNHSDLRDADGKYFIKEAVEKCKKNGKAEHEYRWMVTQINKVVPLVLMVEVVDCGGKKVDLGITYSGKL